MTILNENWDDIINRMKDGHGRTCSGDIPLERASLRLSRVIEPTRFGKRYFCNDM